jgi:hypothetical protein
VNTQAAEQLLFADTLACDDEFSFSLRSPAGPADFADAARRSETALRAMVNLDEARNDESDGAGDTAAPRLEAKLDLALSLLSTLVAQTLQMPPPQPVHWSRRGFRLFSSRAWQDDEPAILSAYWMSALPLPVDLPVVVVACEAADAGFCIWLAVEDTSPALCAAIERVLFRRHRRLVHERRKYPR